MAELSELFERCLPLEAGDAAAVEAQLAEVPDKPAVYLLATAGDEPVLLASGLAVRSILRRRLGEPIVEGDDEPAPGEQPRPARSRRADLRPIVRRLYLRPTCSGFETDLWYLWLARAVLPGSYRGLLRPHYCWMIHADAGEAFPRLVGTAKFLPAGGRRIGPLPDKHAANRLIELLIDLFDLCRYHSILVQAPGGEACAYKQMGRCPAPCDGTVPMSAYREAVAAALAFAAEPDIRRAWRDGQNEQMADAAAALDFERAGRIKARLARADDIDSPKYRRLMDADAMDFLIVQPGPRKAELRTFRGFGGRLVVGPTLTRKSPATGLTDWLKLRPPPLDSQRRADEAALLADYLFKGRPARPDASPKHGLFVTYRGQSADELAEQVARAYPATVRRRKSKPPSDGD